jgi:4-aminobutyrate aminotransferase-like enzyme/Ser/Thr protein kinase RdoA (MazF antagonist)
MSQPVTVHLAPRFTAPRAVEIAHALYGLEAMAEALPSERDQNFKLVTPGGQAYVLKIANASERREVLDFENRAMAHVARRAPRLGVARVVPTRGGETIGIVTAGAPTSAAPAAPGSPTEGDGRAHFVRLLTWVAGKPLALVKPHSEALLVNLGRAVGQLDCAFEGFDHPAMHRPFPWDLTRTLETTADLLTARTSSAPNTSRTTRDEIIPRLLCRFRDVVSPALPSLRRHVIHDDWNDYNVLVRSNAEVQDLTPVTVVDFGDMVHSIVVADLAVAAAYATLDKRDPIGAAAAIVRGYHEAHPLEKREIAILFDLIRARLAISVAMAARQGAAAPGNEYLQISQRQVWTTLAALDAVPPDWAHYVFRGACGLEPCPAAPAVREWIAANGPRFEPVLPLDLRGPRVTRIDLSVGSLDLSRLDTAVEPEALAAHVARRLDEANAEVGVGSYNEARLIYVTELFAHPTNWLEENRTVHLGIDLFAPAGTPVHAVLEGVVHGLRDNRGPGDYGPTIILEHEPAGGPRFYTLYGHLSARSLDSLRIGERVEAGDEIARLGTIAENGGWSPHLHFQVVVDMLGRGGEFPGVAAPGERAVWLSLCPDPNQLLGIPAARLAPPPPEAGDIEQARRRHLGPNMSVSYRRPLTIVRGHRQYLFDADGRRYLDAVNNVPHVGHSHPRVAEAVARQFAVLTTNTRYLHPLLAEYVERLTALLPAPLEVCYIVNSGSEANELALRLARATTGRRGVLVVGAAYHGNTSALVDISPYKFDGPGGTGCPSHVRVASVPAFPPAAQGFSPADQRPALPDLAAELASSPSGLSAFFCESILSCAGQIVLPDGYLAEAYAAVHAAGGVTVADEVQVGFGRVGTHVWAFETQGVVPDIVTLGKPIGNGFPLGAVVTTREIAGSFHNGMEYFNTFGGSPAACAAGLAVLDVMRDEGLQAHALEVGAHLKARLSELRRFPIIGDVRGLGLFLGVEFVRDRVTMEPAPGQAEYLVNRMRERGILLSTDGPHHNVIKIKPPLPFTLTDADRLASVMADTLDEDGAQA